MLFIGYILLVCNMDELKIKYWNFKLWVVKF